MWPNLNEAPDTIHALMSRREVCVCWYGKSPGNEMWSASEKLNGITNIYHYETFVSKGKCEK